MMALIYWWLNNSHLDDLYTRIRELEKFVLSETEWKDGYIRNRVLKVIDSTTAKRLRVNKNYKKWHDRNPE